MIQIEKLADIEKLAQDSTVHPLIVEYIKEYLLDLLKRYDTHSLEDVGAIYWLKKHVIRALNSDIYNVLPF